VKGLLLACFCASGQDDLGSAPPAQDSAVRSTNLEDGQVKVVHGLARLNHAALKGYTVGE
jgi:hypothetical protein